MSSTRIPRQLDPVEIRVLGSLLEKEQTTPEVYPMTVNALLAACNQKTNREPVMQVSEGQVWDALDRLRQDVLVWRTEGARSERWQQSVERRWGLNPAGKALMTLLLLRGAQTAGELRARSERMHAFASAQETEEALARLAGMDEPLVRELPRRPGQKETRWIHLVGEVAEPQETGPEVVAIPADVLGRPSLAARVEQLEQTVARLAEDLESLRRQLGE
ncbi:MAG TPA: YceH family protein [Thermoanaerobaculia bacterium]|nr:YceH family protein [Thermoanaerobaculia bacterium]